MKQEDLPPQAATRRMTSPECGDLVRVLGQNSADFGDSFWGSMDVRVFGFDLELRVRVCMHGAGKRDHAVSRFQSGRQVPCPGDGMDHHALTDWQFVDGPRQGMIRL